MATYLSHIDYVQPHLDNLDNLSDLNDFFGDLPQHAEHFGSTPERPFTRPRSLTPATGGLDLQEQTMDFTDSQYHDPEPTDSRRLSSAQFHQMNPEFIHHDYSTSPTLDFSSDQHSFSMHDLLPTGTLAFNEHIFHNPAGFMTSTGGGMNMSALSAGPLDDVIQETGPEADAIAELTLALTSGQSFQSSYSSQAEPFGPDDQAAIRGPQALAQPQALHGSSLSRSNPVSRMQVQAEGMGESAQYSDHRVSQSSTLHSTADNIFTPPGTDGSESPESAEAAQIPTNAMWSQSQFDQDSRRPSVTTDLAHNFDHVNLQPAQSSEELSVDARYGEVFRRPAMYFDGQTTSLAQRRRQQGPGAIKTMLSTDAPTKPPMNLNRTVSSSAVHKMHNPSKFPASAGHTLRRNKSSQVILGNNRVQKSGHNSARNSPMMTTFSDSMSSQVTPQPLYSTAAHRQSSLTSQSPQQQVMDFQTEQPPISASTSMYTPGMLSGSVPGQSFSNTPVTAGNGFGHQQQMLLGGLHPASDNPQSAPAHINHFHLSYQPSHSMTSMPPTPADSHFAQVLRQMPSFHGPMMEHGPMSILPSQHSAPDSLGSTTIYPEFNMPYGTGMHQYVGQGWSPENYGYKSHDKFLQGHALPMMQRELEIKFDERTVKIKEQAAQGLATLLPVDRRGEGFTFQHLSTHDMKKQLEKD